MTHHAPVDQSEQHPSRRRARGLALVAGAALIAGLVEYGPVPYYWFVLLIGLTYLAAAIASRSRGPLWGPGLITTAVGLAIGLWIRDGRSVDSYQFLALAVMALGLGGVLAALLAQRRGYRISAMDIALPVLLFGAFALLDQQRIEPIAGQTWVYVGLLGAYGLYELRPGTRPLTDP